MATATVERVTYREGNKYPQGLGEGVSGVGEEVGSTSLNEPLLPTTSPAPPPPRPGHVNFALFRTELNPDLGSLKLNK
jgi:hypothetical protein